MHWSMGGPATSQVMGGNDHQLVLLWGALLPGGVSVISLVAGSLLPTPLDSSESTPPPAVLQILLSH